MRLSETDIINRLESSGITKSSGDTVPQTYSCRTNSSLMTEQPGNRSQSGWKKAQYVIMKHDATASYTLEQLLDGWKSVVGNHRDQYLLLEEHPGTWRCYDSYIQEVSLDDILPTGTELNNQLSITSDKYRPYITAIKSKPFLLLAGISGTGKSRIVRELARSCWGKGSDEYKAQKPRNFEMIQVKSNWHDSSELFGYVSRINGEKFIVGPFLKFMVRALKEPNVPYFLCLDEMNLAPVEQYFAEYLSVIESRKLKDDGSIETDPIVDFESTGAYHSLITQLFPKEDEEEDRRLFLSKEGGKRLSIPHRRWHGQHG